MRQDGLAESTLANCGWSVLCANGFSFGKAMQFSRSCSAPMSSISRKICWDYILPAVLNLCTASLFNCKCRHRHRCGNCLRLLDSPDEFIRGKEWEYLSTS